MVEEYEYPCFCCFPLIKNDSRIVRYLCRNHWNKFFEMIHGKEIDELDEIDKLKHPKQCENNNED